jgi:hypothetical protein
MKSFKSLPTNDSFFNYYASLTPTLTKLGFFAQAISAATEIGVIYSIIYSAASDFVPDLAHSIGIAGAVIGTAFLEVGLRKFAPYSVRSILHKKYKGLDMVMTLFIILATAGLLTTSGLLSFKGSKTVVEVVAPDPDLQTDDKAILRFNQDAKALTDQYRADSAAVSTRYSDQIKAKQAYYAALIDVEKNKLQNYIDRERRTGQSYITAKGRIKSQIKALQADQQKVVSDLRSDQGEEMKGLITAKAAQLDLRRLELRTAKEDVRTANISATDRREKLVSGYGSGLAWFTVFGLVVFLVSVILSEVHKKGSGIEEKAQPAQYDFMPSILSELTTAFNNHYQYQSRRLVYWIEGKTPAAQLPKAPNDLYDLTGLQQKKFNVTKEDLERIQADQAKRRQIGFKLPSNDTNENRLNENRYTNEKQRTCHNCEKQYTYRHHKQKYCCDQCRIEAWEKRTGAKLKKGKKK